MGPRVAIITGDYCSVRKVLKTFPAFEMKSLKKRRLVVAKIMRASPLLYCAASYTDFQAILSQNAQTITIQFNGYHCTVNASVRAVCDKITE